MCLWVVFKLMPFTRLLCAPLRLCGEHGVRTYKRRGAEDTEITSTFLECFAHAEI